MWHRDKKPIKNTILYKLNGLLYRGYRTEDTGNASSTCIRVSVMSGCSPRVVWGFGATDTAPVVLHTFDTQKYVAEGNPKKSLEIIVR